jgi:hypothetical protein
MERELTEPKSSPNNTLLAGQLASRKITFGRLSRYAVAAVHTRFDAVEWFVWDAENPGYEVIRQDATFRGAIAGLEEKS